MKPTLPHIVATTVVTLALLSGCRAQTAVAPATPANDEAPLAFDKILPPLKQAFACLPKEAAFVAAHRGTSLNRGLPENSMGGLLALIDAGFYFSEIDVAGLKDGTLILMHDGVLDRTTVKEGPVASQSWADVNSLLLRDTDGRITTDTLPQFEDILQRSKGKIYLEIDFKSSAKFEAVIAQIRQNDMADQVILIAYSDGQARKLASLAPDMMISLTIKSNDHFDELKSLGIKTENMTAWTGREAIDPAQLRLLTNNQIRVLAMRSPQEQDEAIVDADLIVSDYALDGPPILGTIDEAAFKACLAQ